jgi:hypothetical protein
LTAPASRVRQRGISLVEVALASAVLGVCVVLLWGVSEQQTRTEKSDRTTSMIERAQDAVLAFAYLHGHLPCPASSGDGKASCGAGDTGFLPYLTLGLPAPEAGKIRYTVSTAAPSLVTGSPYRVAVGRRTGPLNGLTAQVVPLASVSPAGHEVLFDLCAALGGASHGAMAYALATDAGTSGGTGPIAATGSAMNVDSVDAVSRSVGRSQLAAQLGCASLSASARAHFNAALAAQTMSRAMLDYTDLYELGFHTYAADLAQGVWFETNAIFTTTRAYTKMTVAEADEKSTNHLKLPNYVLARTLFGASGVYAAAHASNVIRFANNLATAKVRQKTVHALLASTERTAKDIGERAVLASSSAFFIDQKAKAP